MLCEPREGRKKAALDRVFPRVGPSKFQVPSSRLQIVEKSAWNLRISRKKTLVRNH